MKIPANPQAVTAEWLTNALRQTRAIHQARVKSIETELLGGAKGITGQMTRLSLAYDENEEQTIF